MLREAHQAVPRPLADGSLEAADTVCYAADAVLPLLVHAGLVGIELILPAILAGRQVGHKNVRTAHEQQIASVGKECIKGGCGWDVRQRV